MDNTTQDIFDAIAEIANLPARLFKQNAINSPIPFHVGGRGRTHRLVPTDLVRIEGDALVSVTTDATPTHIVTECRGSLYIDLFEVDCRDLETNEVITIKL
jgi:hypothetical protein